MKMSRNQIRSALINIGLNCPDVAEGSVENLRDLNDLFAELLSKSPDEIVVRDPTGQTKFAIQLQPSRAFKSGILLISNGEALLIGHDPAGSVIFIANDGCVGLAYELPDDISELTFDGSDDGKYYWNLDLIEWLNEYKKLGRDLF